MKQYNTTTLPYNTILLWNTAAPHAQKRRLFRFCRVFYSNVITCKGHGEKTP